MKTTITSFLCLVALSLAGQIPQNGLRAYFNFNGTQGFNSNVNGNAIIPNAYTSNSRTGGSTKPSNFWNRYNEADSAGYFDYTSYQYELADNGSVKNSRLKIKKEITFGGWMVLYGYDQFNVTPILFGVWGPVYSSYGLQGNVNNGNIYMFMSSDKENNQPLTVNIGQEGSQAPEYYHHVMGTLASDDTMRLYFQGRLVAKRKFNGDSIKYFDYSNGKQYFSMGADYNSNGWSGTGFLGGLDDVLIYDRALSSQEIWTLFNNSSKCKNNTGVRSGQLFRNNQNGTSYLTMTDTTVWHNDECEFEWYANNNYGLTTKKSGGKTISITQNATYKVKVVHRATRCWYWTNEVVVTDLAGGTNHAFTANAEGLKIGPNPAEDKLVIKSEQNIKSINVCTADGKNIALDKVVTDNEYLINTNSWKPGIYLISIDFGNHKAARKIIKN